MVKSDIYRHPKPQVLQGRDIASVADYILSNGCKNIILMLGAGVSTSAGIPDFRSPETGLYTNLARLNLPFPEAVFEINFFRRNPVPFYTLAKELYPGKFRPTITHTFIRLLASHSLLHTCFTQNIDTLERRAGVPEDKIIEAHGSFATQRCINCQSSYDHQKMKENIKLGTIARCESCNGYVKPDIVFFGESLPPEFIRAIPLLGDADLLIVIGTSLTVQPFASLAEMVAKSCPRVLINLVHVGDFGSRPDDVVFIGKCDEIVKELCEELGWEEELLDAWEETAKSIESDDLGDEDDTKSKLEDDTLGAIETLTRDIEELTVEEKDKAPSATPSGHQASCSQSTPPSRHPGKSTIETGADSVDKGSDGLKDVAQVEATNKEDELGGQLCGADKV